MKRTYSATLVNDQGAGFGIGGTWVNWQKLADYIRYAYGEGWRVTIYRNDTPYLQGEIIKKFTLKG